MSKRPGYLFVVPWRITDVGGVNQVVLNLYRQFEAGGVYAPRIFVTSWDNARPATIVENGRFVTYMRLRAPTASVASAGAFAKWAVMLLPEVARIAHYLRANDVTIVNVHYPSLAALQFILVRLLLRRRLRIILSFHGLDLGHAVRANVLERWIWRILLRSADAVVSCSNAQSESISAFDPAIRRRVTTIHNGVDIDHLMAARNHAARIDPRLEGRPFILSVASYEPKKGLDTLLHAFKSVRDDHGVDAMLAIAGPDQGMGNKLRELAVRMDLLHHVVFCGEVRHADLHAYYEAASVFCLPSRAEPFGIVLLEAGAFRCPVVATSVGGIPEILENGVNACLVPPDDTVALAAELKRLLGDGSERDRLASALYEHVRTGFPWNRAHGLYVKLCEKT